MREPQPAHIQRQHRSALGPVALSCKLEMTYTAFSPRQLAKAEKVRLLLRAPRRFEHRPGDRPEALLQGHREDRQPSGEGLRGRGRMRRLRRLGLGHSR